MDAQAEIQSGDHRRALTALRDLLAASVAVAEPNVVAQIAGRLQSVLTELAAMPEAKAVTSVDEVRRRREGRRTAAKAQPPAAGQG